LEAGTTRSNLDQLARNLEKPELLLVCDFSIKIN